MHHAKGRYRVLLLYFLKRFVIRLTRRKWLWRVCCASALGKCRESWLKILILLPSGPQLQDRSSVPIIRTNALMLYTLSNNGDNLSHDYWQDSGECMALVTSRSAAKVVSEAKADNFTRDMFTPASQRCGYVGDSSICEAKNIVFGISFKARQLSSRLCLMYKSWRLYTLFSFGIKIPSLDIPWFPVYVYLYLYVIACIRSYSQ